MAVLALCVLVFFQTGCMMGYIARSGYDQARLLRQRVPIEQAPEKFNLTDEQKSKLILAGEAREFAIRKLGFKDTDNYKTYVHLDRPYVTHIVQAADAWKLKPYHWSFPIVGKVPYLGFFDMEKARAKAREFDPQKYDTYVRGVSAYSTLGWFEDPLLSSMLRYDDHELVDTVIHELAHATLYIKSNADFNEQMATFLGQYGAELFYLEKEGANSKTRTRMRDEIHDKKVFSQFLKPELEQLEKWFEQEDRTGQISQKTKRLSEIQDRFKSQVLPRLKTDMFKSFESEKLNNALLLALKTYFVDLELFEKLLVKKAGDFKAVMTALQSLEKSQDPKVELEKLVK